MGESRVLTAGGLAGAAPPAHQAERAGQGGRGQAGRGQPDGQPGPGQGGRGQQTGQPGRDQPANRGGRGQRRAGRRKVAVLEAAGRVIAERGADATRFADVAAASGVPVSTLQYYFGSREDLLVAAFRHASATEIAELETEIAGLDDPWQQLTRVVTSAVTGYEDAAAGSGRLWIESWHLGIRDAEMRADAIRDYGAWRALVAGVVRRGRDAGAFAPRLAPEHVAVLTIALVDGVGIPLALGDPQITADGAVADVLAALRDVLHATGQAG